MGIQEHRIIHKDPNQIIAYQVMGAQYLITSSAWRNAAQASVGGVGIALNSDARKALLSVKSVSPRIRPANFSSNPVTTVISAYALTNSAPEQEMGSIYSELSSAISAVPAHNFLPILGEFNGRLGKGTVPFSYHEECNRNGEYLHYLIEEHALLATNTQFQKPPKRL